MNPSLDHRRGNDAHPSPPFLLHGCLNTRLSCNVVERMQEQMSTCKERHTCSLQRESHTEVSLSLPVRRVWMVASWWVQLEFHTQLGSCSNGNRHVPANPLHTAATVAVYIANPYDIIRSGWWQVREKNQVIYVLLKAWLGLIAQIIRYKDMKLLFSFSPLAPKGTQLQSFTPSNCIWEKYLRVSENWTPCLPYLLHLITHFIV